MPTTMGSSSLLHYSPLTSHSSFSFPTSPLSYRPLFFFNPPNVEGKFIRNNHHIHSRTNKALLPMASLQHHHQQQLGPTDIDAYKRRALLILGISLLPLLPSKNEPFQASASEIEDISGKENQAQEPIRPNSPPSNPFLSLLNAIGVLGAGVLAALYSLARKDKASSEAVIESLNFQLNEKNAAIISLKNDYEFKLLNQKEEQNELLRRAKEEQLALRSQLESAKSTINGLGRELQSEKRDVEQLKGDIAKLELEVRNAVTEKGALEEKLTEKNSSIAILQERGNLLTLEIKDKEAAIKNLMSLLEQKDADLTTLGFSYKQTKDELDGRDAEILNLNKDILTYKEKLEQKNSEIEDLNASINSLTAEQDDLNKQLTALHHEYDDLKASSGEKAAGDAKLLEQRSQELLELKERYEEKVNEVTETQAQITSLTEDKKNLQEELNQKLKDKQISEEQLQVVQESLETSKNEAVKWQALFDESREECSNLEKDIAKVRTDLSETKVSLQKSLREAVLHSETLNGELSSVKEALNRTTAELQLVSNELAATSQSRDSLQKELLEVYKKTESVTNDLKEERKMVASLHSELQALEKELQKDKETRQTMASDLQMATRSLDEITKHASMLSEDLKMSRSQVSSLEQEKEDLNTSLEMERRVAKEAQQTLEDAHNIVNRLQSERETLMSRAGKLEENLASAKGEILRLRAQMNSPKAVVNNEPEQGNGIPAAESQPKRRTSSLAKNQAKQEAETIPTDELEQKAESASVSDQPKPETEPIVTATASAPVKKTTRRRKTNNK